MKANFICVKCGYMCEMECDPYFKDQPIYQNDPDNDELCPSCGECHSFVKVEEGDVDLNALTSADINISDRSKVVIPDNKALCTSLLANMATLRAGVTSAYEIQAKIDVLQSGVAKRIENIRILQSNNDRFKNNDLNPQYYDSIGSDSDILKFQNTVLSNIESVNFEEDDKQAKNIEKKYKLLNILGTIFITLGISAILTAIFVSLWLPYYSVGIIVGIALGLIFYFITRRIAFDHKYEYILPKLQKKHKSEYMEKQYLADLNKYISARKQEVYDKIRENENKINEYRVENGRAIAAVNSLRQALKREVNYLDGMYCGIVHKSDWENLDYIIYLFITGRADNLKEALHMVDEQRRTEMIVKAIGMATQYLSNNISSALSSLGSELSASMSRISADLTEMRGAMATQSNEYLKGINKVVDLDKTLCDYSRQSYQMMKNINVSLNN